MASLRTASSVFGRVPPLPVLLKRKRKERRIEPTMRTPPRDDTALSGCDVERMLAAARKAPDLTLIEWDGDHGLDLALPRVPAPRPRLDWMPLAPDRDARCRKIRERYVRARFPGVVRDAPDLQSDERVIKSARLYFEDGQPELAFELMECALEENPRAESIWLARLELLFLQRDAAGFVACARAFREAHAQSTAWGEVARLGCALAPEDFGPAGGPREHEHYGPWPHLPNWIQASWDLTAEVAAADFHRAIARRAAAQSPNAQSD